MGKLPAFQFYTGDWLKDPNLSMCSPSTRGIWIDFICAMHELDRSGQVTGTAEQLARACRCTASEMIAALTELKETGTASISEREGRFTVASRRMSRECYERESSSERKRIQRIRDKGGGVSREGHANVTLPSSSSSSLSTSSSSPGGDEQSAKRGEPRPRQLPTCDEEYLSSLQAHPAYKALNVRLVFSKMVAWCELHRKEPTRGRLLNWLNREDQPMNGASVNGKAGNATPKPGKYANRR